MVGNGHAFRNDPWNEKFVTIIAVNQLQATGTFKFRHMTCAYLDGLAILENRIHIDLCSVWNGSENISLLLLAFGLFDILYAKHLKNIKMRLKNEPHFVCALCQLQQRPAGNGNTVRNHPRNEIFVPIIFVHQPQLRQLSELR